MHCTDPNSSQKKAQMSKPGFKADNLFKQGTAQFNY